MKIGIGLKIVSVVEIVVVGFSLLGGVGLYFVLNDVFQKRIYAQLESVSTIKEATIGRFLEEVKIELEHLTEYSVTNALLQKYFETKTKPNRLVVADILDEVLRHKNIFSEIYLFDKDGVIVFATTQTDEGKLVVSEPYFVNAQNKTFLQDFYFDPTLGQPVMMMATPVKDEKGKLLGVVAGRINIKEISDLMGLKSGMGKTGETFLVNSFNVVVTELAKEPDVVMKKTIFNPQTTACINGNSLQRIANDYHGDQVIGNWKWIPSIRSCMVTKLDLAEAREPIVSTFKLLLGISGVAFGMAIVFGLLLGRAIVKPVYKLREEVLKVKQGNYDIEVKVDSRDELQEVAETFNEMAREVKAAHNELENRVVSKTKDLESKIKELEKTNELMVGREVKMIELKKELANLKINKEK